MNKKIVVKKFVPPGCSVCGSPAVEYYITYWDADKPGYTDKQGHTYATAQERACALHVVEATAILYKRQGFLQEAVQQVNEGGRQET